MRPRRSFRTGLVGAGYVCPFHIEALRRLPCVELIGLTDIDPERAQQTARRFGVDRVFPSLRAMADAGLDVVHVLTPPHTHAAVALEAMELGCDVLVEKPLATSVEDCDHLIETATRLGRRAGVNHSLLGDDQVRRALATVRRGDIGQVLAAEVFYSSVYPPYVGGPLPPHYREGGYPFRDLGVHALYLVREFLGELQSAQAEFRSHGADPNLSFDTWSALVRCEKGPATIHLSWAARPLQHVVRIHGTRGTLRLDLAYLLLTRRRNLPLPDAAERIVNALADSAPPFWQVPRNVWRFLTRRLRPYQPLHNLVATFYESLASGAPLPATLEMGREVVRWVEVAARPADVAKAERSRRYEASGRPAIVVTGAGGFLGRHLVARLMREELDTRLRLFLRREPRSEWLYSPRVEVVLGDLGDPEAVERALRGATAVYHLGAAMRGNWEDHERGTVRGTANVVESCLRLDLPKLVHVSSLSVIHWAGLDGSSPVSESAPLEPRPQDRGAYTRAKLAAERLVAEAASGSRLHAVILRPGQIFGPDGPLDAVCGGQLLGRRIVILGSGRAIVPLVYVDDVIDALLVAAQRGPFDGTVYQVVDDGQMTERELARLAAQALGLQVFRLPQIVALPLALALGTAGKALSRSMPLNVYRLRSSQARLRFDATKIRTELGWQPTVGYREGLRLTLEAHARGSLGATPTLPAEPSDESDLRNTRSHAGRSE